MDVKNIIKKYRDNNFSDTGGEMSFLWYLEDIEEWNSLTREEKLEYRRKYILYFEKHFMYDEIQEKKHNYMKLIYEVQTKMLECLSDIDSYQIDSKENEYWYRLNAMFYWEVESIFMFKNFKKIGHIPLFIFEPLIERVKKTDMYIKYEIEELFIKYQKMYELFLLKLYDTKE
ncbi:MAG: hypothetical protein LBI72_05125 [Flavobacteriaceae bacterium]|jgi:hypothetical protein|nr:hypothetical protein [Flavobacteriaceae bacterium]